MKREHLLALCKDRGITGVSDYTKQQLLDALDAQERARHQNHEKVTDICVKVPTNQLRIDKIFHIADIQVRPLSRHEEFNGVFKNLYQKLKHHKAEQNSAIVICGDILQEKDKLKPETIMILRNFFKNLLEICPYTIVIAGNHDLVENNNDRLDNLTPILDNIGVYYLRKSGAYRFGNVVFAVTSLIDKIHVNRNTIKTEPNTKYIALYHGMLDGAAINEDITITSDSFRDSRKLSEFDGYDYVMLGDIHTHQYLKPHIAYSGSLVQQNFGEPLEGHGMIKWNIAKASSKFIEIENEYGFVNIIVRKGKLHKEVPMPAKPYIRYHAVLTTEEQLRHFRETFEQNLNPQRIESRYITQAINEIPVELTQKTDDTDLLKQELKDDVQSEDIDFLVEYHQKIKNELNQTEDNINTQTWKILKLEFRNIMIYGNNVLNIIDFTKLGHIISICGKNAIGKSCIQKMLLFALFDKFALGGANSDKNSVLNKDAKDCFIAIEVLYGNTRYRIEKTGKARQHYGRREMKFNNNFYKIRSNGDKVSLNAEHRIKTNNNINDILGINYNDFLLTNLYSNTVYLSILNITETERLDTLNKYFRLDWYKQLLIKVREDIKTIEDQLTFAKGQMNNIETEIQETDKGKIKARLLEIKDIISPLKEAYNTLETKFNTAHEDKMVINTQIIHLNRQITVDPSDYDQVELPNKPHDITENPRQIQEEIDNARMKIVPGTRKLNQIQEELDTLIYEVDQLQEPTLSKDDVNYELNKHLFHISEQEDLLEKCGDFEIMPDANVSDLEQVQRSLEARVEYTVFIREKKQIPTEEFNNLDNLIQNYNKLRTELIQDLNNAESYDNKLIIKKETRSKLLDFLNYDISEQRNKYNKIMMDIQYNEEINKEIRLNEEIQDKKRQLKKINGNIIKLTLDKMYTERDKLQLDKKYYQLSERIQELYKQKDIIILNNQHKKKIEELEKRLEEITKAEHINLLLKNKDLINKLNTKQEQLDNKQQKENKISAKMKELSQRIDDLEREHDQLIDIYQAVKQQKTKQRELSTKIIQLEQTLERYKIYTRVVDRNGLPLRLINTKIEDLTNEVNNFLSSFVRFQIKIQADTQGKRPRLIIVVSKNNINLSTQDLSGYETFVLNLAFKFALSRHNFIGKCSLLCIDEGLDCIDEDNFSRLGDLFSKLRTQYSQIMVISHIPGIKEYEDSTITIQNNGKHSIIT